MSRPRQFWTDYSAIQSDDRNSGVVNQRCRNCNNVVTRAFVRVHAVDNREGVFACPGCAEAHEIIGGESRGGRR